QLQVPPPLIPLGDETGYHCAREYPSRLSLAANSLRGVVVNVPYQQCEPASQEYRHSDQRPDQASHPLPHESDDKRLYMLDQKRLLTPEHNEYASAKSPRLSPRPYHA